MPLKWGTLGDPSVPTYGYTFGEMPLEFGLIFSVFEIARWTEARDWQKQCRSGKATVFAGPKVRQ